MMVNIKISNSSSGKPLHFVLLIVVQAVTLVVYWPGLSGPLLLDDIPNLYHIFRFGDGIISWHEAFDLTLHAGDRPVAILSFMGNLWISPGNVWQLKLTNLVIHLLCGLLIYRLSWLLLYRTVSDDLKTRYIALWIAALWLLSPFLVSTVLYVIQRMAQLSAFFMLCGLVLYTTGRINLDNHKKPAIGLIVISLLVFWPLATLSKQNGILLPLLMLIMEFFFFHTSSVQKHIKKLRVWLFCLSCIPLLIIGTGIFLFDYSLLDYSGRNFTLYERLITQPRVLLDYMANLLLIPGASPMSLFHDDYVKSTGLLHPVTTLPALLFTPGIIFLGLVCYRKKIGIVLFGIVFFYAAHLVESTFIPLEMYFEHRNYLPAFGLYFSVVYGMYLLLEKIDFNRSAIIVLLLFPIAFSILTYQRALVWQKKTSLYFLSEITHPDSPRINEGLSYFYLLLNDPGKSVYYLDRVLALDPGHKSADFYFKYLLAYCNDSMEVPEPHYLQKLKFSGLSDELSTINYFRMFIDAVEAGKCDSLDLDKVADQLKAATAGSNSKYGTAHVNGLLSRLLSYLDRDEEAEEMRITPE